MDVVNFPAIIEKYGMLTPSEVDKFNDLILIGKKVKNLRDGSQYQNAPMRVKDLFDTICSLNLGESFKFGPEVTYVHPSGVGSANYDEVGPGIRITRGLTQPLFNAASEVAYNPLVSPANTLWAYNPTNFAQVKNMTYDLLQNLVVANLGGFAFIPGTTWIMHDLISDKYYFVRFLSWEQVNGGGFSYERKEIYDICDGCITFPDGSKMCTAPGAAPAFSLPAADYYVDALLGNDGTALPNRLDKPYQTIQAALAAAPEGVPALIYVRSGTYAPPTLTFKNLVDFYFEPGSVMVSGGFQDGGNARTAKVRGHLNVNGFVGVLAVSAASTIDFEFDTINTTFYGFSITPSVSKAKVNIKGNRIDATPFAGFNFLCTFRGFADITFIVREYVRSDRNAIFIRQTGAFGYSGNLYIETPEITMNGAPGSNFERTAVTLGFLTSPTANITIKANIFTTGIPVGGTEHYAVSLRGGRLKLIGNISGGAFCALSTDGALGDSGRGHIIGSITSDREAIHQSNTNYPLIVEQGLIASNGVGAYPYTIIQGVGFPGLPDQPDNKLYLKDCRLYNSLPDSAIARIDITALGNNIYMYNCEAVTEGVVGELLTAVSPVTSGFHNVRTNKANNVLVTDLFTPTGVIVDAGLVIPTY